MSFYQYFFQQFTKFHANPDAKKSPNPAPRIAVETVSTEATKHFLCNCNTCSLSLDPVRGFRCLGRSTRYLDVLLEVRINGE